MSSKYIICGVEKYYTYYHYNDDDAENRYGRTGVMVWGHEDFSKIVDGSLEDNSEVNGPFVAYAFDNLTLLDVVNETGLDTFKPFSGEEADGIRLTSSRDKSSVVYGTLPSGGELVGKPYKSFVNSTVSDLLVDWFVDFCDFVFTKLNSGECVSVYQRSCPYCHMKYDNHKNIIPIRSLLHDDSSWSESDYQVDSAYAVLKGYEDDGDPDYGGGGRFEFNIRIKHCPKCGRKLLVDCVDAALYTVDHHLHYTLHNTDQYS